MVTNWVIMLDYKRQDLGGFRHADTIAVNSNGIEIITYLTQIGDYKWHLRLQKIRDAEYAQRNQRLQA